jgi:hypothetical protein
MGLMAGLLLGPVLARAEIEIQGNENSSVGIYAGYAKVNFGSLEGHFQDLGRSTGQSFIDYLVGTGSTGTTDFTVNEVTGAIQVGADMLSWMSGGFGFGGRLNLLLPSVLEMKAQGSGAYDESFSYQSKLSSLLISPMVEVCFKSPIGDWVELDLMLAAGLGWSVATINYQQHIVDPFYNLDQENSTTANLNGVGFQMQAGANLGIRVSENMSVFASAGYNYCNIAEMRYTEGIDADGDGYNEVNEGDVYGDPDTQKAFNFDFSGVFLGAGVQFTL